MLSGKYRSLKKILTAFIFLLGQWAMLTAISQAQIQYSSEAFGKIKIGLSVQENINRNYFHDYWSASKGAQIDLETPFYAGDIFISGRYVDFSSKEDHLPDFDNLDVMVGWGDRYPVLKNLEVGGAVGMVYSLFTFKNLTDEMIEYGRVFGTTSPESEIGFLIRADLTYHINNVWGIQIRWNRNVVYTHTKLKLNYLGIGVFRTVSTPKWLKQVLK